jgi:hypothetical protein
MAQFPRFQAADPRALPQTFVTGNTTYETMSVSELLALPEADFHPPLNEKRVQWYAENWDDDVLEPPGIAVHFGSDIDGNDITGQFVVYEGRHRIRGALQARGEDWRMPVRVTRGDRKAAQLFAALNGSRRKFGSIEDFNARLSGGEERQILVLGLAQKHGFTVGGTRITETGRRVMGGRGVWHINAITALYDALEWGEDILDNTLAVIAEVTRRREEQGTPIKENTWTAAKVIQGVAYVLNLYEGEIDAEVLIEALAEVPPYVAAPTNANSAGRNGARVASLYNGKFHGRSHKRLRLEKIPLRYRSS